MKMKMRKIRTMLEEYYESFRTVVQGKQEDNVHLKVERNE